MRERERRCRSARARSNELRGWWPTPAAPADIDVDVVVGERGIGIGSGVASAEVSWDSVPGVVGGRESSIAEEAGETPLAAWRDCNCCCCTRIIWRSRFCGLLACAPQLPSQRGKSDHLSLLLLFQLLVDLAQARVPEVMWIPNPSTRRRTQSRGHPTALERACRLHMRLVYHLPWCGYGGVVEL